MIFQKEKAQRKEDKNINKITREIALRRDEASNVIIEGLIIVKKRKPI